MRDEIRRWFFRRKKVVMNDREGLSDKEVNIKDSKNNKDDITELLNSLPKVEMGQHTEVLNTNRGHAEHGAKEKNMDTNPSCTPLET